MKNYPKNKRIFLTLLTSKAPDLEMTVETRLYNAPVCPLMSPHTNLMYNKKNEFVDLFNF